MSRSAVSPSAAIVDLHILVPVWGAKYCEIFTEISLPSQLAPGNIPALPNRGTCLYHVITRAEDAPLISGSEAWAKLSSLMPVRMDLWTDFDRPPHEIMSACLRGAIAHADERGAASLFFNPDLVFADGCMRAIGDILRTGKRVIFTTGIRLLKETVQQELVRRRSEDGILSLPARELAGLAMKHPHPITRNHVWNGGEGTLIPANLLWRIGDEGYLARCFHLHPLLVWPQKRNVTFAGTVDDDFVSMACPDPDLDHVVTDSDELLMCEISGFEHRVDTTFRKGNLADLVDWAESHTDARHRRLVTHTIRLHGGNMTEAYWAEAEAESDRVIGHVLGALSQGSGRLLLRSPMRAARRWVRQATDLSVLMDNAHTPSALSAGWSRFMLDFFRRYAGFARWYVKARKSLSDALFGPDDHPYPWNALWFTHHRLIETILARVEERPGTSTLVLASDALSRRILAEALPSAIVPALPLRGVAADQGAVERWPYEDGAFERVLCLEAVAQTPDPKGFLGEMARVLKRGGTAFVASPFLSRNPDPSSKDYVHLSIDGLAASLPPSMRVTQSEGLGGVGTALAHILRSWAANEGPTRRLSPILLELPLLPLILAIRFLAGMLGLGLVTLLDTLDRTRRFYAHILLVLEQNSVLPDRDRTGLEPSSAPRSVAHLSPEAARLDELSKSGIALQQLAIGADIGDRSHLDER